MRLWTLALACLASVASVASVAAAADVLPASGCFELPIAILSPVNKAFPTKQCVQAPYPSENCLKERVTVDVEVVQHVPPTNSSAPLNCMSDAPTSVHRSVAHFRGQSSLGFNKHQFSVKLDEAAEFLGFPEDRSYVLHGPHIDSSLVRNHVAHWLFRATGRYSPRTRHIVVFLRDVETKNLKYLGVYLALEKISYGPNRVGLAELTNKCTPSEYSGGWAWQYNPLNFGVYSPNTIGDKYDLMFGPGERPVLMYPPPEALTQSMRDFFVNTSTGPLPQLFRYLFDRMTDYDELEKHIDIGSFVDYMLHSELSQNTDAYRRSTYFFKDRDQPINAGPVWDFNLAFGTGNNRPVWLYEPFLLWRRLLINHKFVSLTIKRWRELRATVWRQDAINAFIDDAVAPLNRQFSPCKQWNSPNMPCAYVNAHSSFEDSVESVKRAIEGRAKWMDENILKLYGKVDRHPWGTATNLPSYNCAADGEDDGCLTNPEKYINAVEMPPVRQPYQGKPCSAEPQEEASIDPCWMSAGRYLSDGSITPFCSGNGYCPQGPGAKCQCVRGKLPPTCGSLNLPTSDDYRKTVAPVVNAKATKTWGSALYLLVLVGGVFAVLLTAHYRRRAGYSPIDG